MNGLTELFLYSSIRDYIYARIEFFYRTCFISKPETGNSNHTWITYRLGNDTRIFNGDWEKSGRD